jgi:hypothetical protein
MLPANNIGLEPAGHNILARYRRYQNPVSTRVTALQINLTANFTCPSLSRPLAKTKIVLKLQAQKGWRHPHRLLTKTGYQVGVETDRAVQERNTGNKARLAGHEMAAQPRYTTYGSKSYPVRQFAPAAPTGCSPRLPFKALDLQMRPIRS